MLNVPIQCCLSKGCHGYDVTQQAVRRCSWASEALAGALCQVLNNQVYQICNYQHLLCHMSNKP